MPRANPKSLVLEPAICSDAGDHKASDGSNQTDPESEKKDIKLSETIVDMHKAVRHRMRATQCALDGLVF